MEMISKYSGVFFYCRIKKLRQQACYDVPEHNFKKNTDMTAEKQEGVCVNVLPEVTENTFCLLKRMIYAGHH